MLPITPSSTQRFWFPAKRYGWGWGAPTVWQGWFVLIAWVAVLAVVTSFLAGRYWYAFAAFMIIMAAVLIAVCFAKGEPPRWR